MRALLALLSPLLLAGCPQVLATEPAGEPAFEAGATAETPALGHEIWDDGQAEIASYRVVQRKYGELREGEAVLIVVKEDFDADALVKADGPRHPHTVTAMKLNHVLTVPTGVYTYRQMASTWLTRPEGLPLKLAISSQEWCGQTHKVLTVRGDEALLRTFSYFGAEGERAFGVPLDDVTVLGDALPLWLRTLDLEDPSTRTLRVVDEQLSNHAAAPRTRRAQVSVDEPETVDVPAGTFEVVPVTVRRGESVERFAFRREHPHTLVRWDRTDGGHYELAWVRRAPYWDMNGVEDVGALSPPVEVPQPAPGDEPQPSLEDEQ